MNEPRRRGRPRKHSNGDLVTVPSGMPAAEDVAGSERERLAAWWRDRIRDMQVAYDERIEILRTVGEHPSPVFAKLVRIDGALGMPKSVVAKKLGISIGSLEAWYGDEYDLGAAEIISQVAANAIRVAVSQSDPNAARVAMQILDRRGGEEWKPPSNKIEVSQDKTAAPIVDSSKMSAEDRQLLRGILERTVNGTGEAETEDSEGI